MNACFIRQDDCLRFSVHGKLITDVVFECRCEKGVMSSVNVRNCIRFYQTAEELDATTLMNYCAEIIASHWVSSHHQ